VRPAACALTLSIRESSGAARAVFSRAPSSRANHSARLTSFFSSPAFQYVMFLFLLVGFAIKVPVFPFHTWLPDAHVEAPTAGSVILAGVLLKMGTYGFVRFSLPLFPQATVQAVPWVVTLAIIGIAFATEASSFATFAGLLTAGVAVAMQSVLVSIVGYFFLVGKYGLRVGDRVQIGNVTGEVLDLGLVRLHLMELGPQHGPTGRVVAFPNSAVFQPLVGIFKQIPGVNLAWREVTLEIPDDGDYTAVKERLLEAAQRVLKDYRDEIERQTRELRRAASSRATEEAQAHVQLRFSAGSIDAIVRYPVPVQRAAEVEERMSRALRDAIRAGAAEPARLTAQPT